jgi:hypothetical protein
VGIASFPPPMPATVYELLGGKHADEIAEKTCRTLTLFASYLQVSFSVGRDLSSQPGFVTRSRRAISARSGHRTFEGCLPLLSLRSNFSGRPERRLLPSSILADDMPRETRRRIWRFSTPETSLGEETPSVPLTSLLARADFRRRRGRCEWSKGFLRDCDAATYNSALGPMSVNGMARPSSYPAGDRCWDGARPNEHRHVQQINRDHCPDGHRYRQEFVPRRWARSARRDLLRRRGHGASLKYGSPQMARSEKCSD